MFHPTLPKTVIMTIVSVQALLVVAAVGLVARVGGQLLSDEFGPYIDTACCSQTALDKEVRYVSEAGCRTGYSCYMGKARSEMSCGPLAGFEMFYDESLGICNWSWLMQCISSCPGPDGSVAAPTPRPVAPPTCPVGSDNLGPLLSASDYQGTFRVLGSTTDLFSPPGRESQIGLLVGGNYNGLMGEEIEGRIVVLGDFIIGPDGVDSIGWGGSGSGIFPYLGTFLQVGGNIAGGKVEGTTQSMVGGTIEYGGTCVTETPVTGFTDRRCGTWHTNGAGLFQKKPMNKQPFLDLFTDLQQKSSYWSSMTPNGIMTLTDLDASESTITLEKGNDDCVQVFQLTQMALSRPAKMILHPNLAGKTILINVELAPDGSVTIDKLTNVMDTAGTSGLYFESTTKAAMLWNFGTATSVTLGNAKGGIDFPGTVLVPHGHLNMLLPGQDGRTIVYGNVNHNAPGSQFHNYDFDPPCALCGAP